MKALKHIITWDCHRDCSYCINQYVVQEDMHGWDDVTYAYKYFADCGYERLILTGGEPTREPDKIKQLIFYGRWYFKAISLYTTNPKVLNPDKYWSTILHVDDIVFSLHDGFYNAPVNYIPREVMPVYAAMVYKNYLNYESVARTLLRRGYSGLSLLREWPNGRRPDILLPEFSNFSLVYKDDCSQGDILTPDLRLAKCVEEKSRQMAAYRV